MCLHGGEVTCDLQARRQALVKALGCFPSPGSATTPRSTAGNSEQTREAIMNHSFQYTLRNITNKLVLTSLHMHLCTCSRIQTIAATSAEVWEEDRSERCRLSCSPTSIPGGQSSPEHLLDDNDPENTWVKRGWPHFYAGWLCGCSIWQQTHN